MTADKQYRISSEPADQNVGEITHLLQLTYWAKYRPAEIIRRSLEHSINFSVFAGDKTVGFARVISDRAVFAYLCDVVIDPDYRGRGLSKLLMEAILSHPDLQTLRRFSLLTHDAHDLYRKFGFENGVPERYMERYDPCDSVLSHEVTPKQ